MSLRRLLRTGPVASAAAAVVLGITGCGGSSGAKPQFDRDTVLKCLNAEGHGVKAYSYTNKLSLLATSGGDIRVVFPFGLSWIYMVFAKDPTEARAIEQRAVVYAAKKEYLSKASVKAGVRVVGNVFFYADSGAVTSVEEARVKSCLR